MTDDASGIEAEAGRGKLNLAPAVVVLLRGKKRIENLFHGEGPCGRDAGGDYLQRDGEGYDYAFLRELVLHGVYDLAALSGAVAARPGNKGKAGPSYCRALATEVVRDFGADKQIDFKLEKLRIYVADPPTYKLEIDGVGITVRSVDDLIDAPTFRKRFIERVHRIPKMPAKIEAWHALVDRWLSEAERVELPPEASSETLTRDAIRYHVDRMPVGSKLIDLDNGSAVLLNKHLVFKTRPLLDSLRENERKLSAHDLCRNLRAMGFDDRSVRIGAEVVRAWVDYKERESPAEAKPEALGHAPEGTSNSEPAKDREPGSDDIPF